ncbi:helix-turn-helix transcriptional regulator [Geobacter sp. FeAm09]|uniref:Helix-turn-helix transcriptional regulator n=1 Tax=Oryzomonas sagensis TaxID=2603857 RepID=A0ABQ6TPV5_9BACT|nr:MULTISPECIES: helix-turn-helix transcriptional regulator [Geobacteraceae]KAB0670340.1 helix-turn-helix transcriptional regulator [Oryzomonas sagensis]QEM67583.1 helix-turn-helix transcriptional regulator [Geobacter sp. FeAm09]
MQALTKKPRTENLVPLHLMVHPANVASITKYAEALENSESIPWREVAGRRGSIPASILRGARSKAEMTQTRLSELTGIPQRHISEMEQGKRPIGRETAKKLATALDVDYRVLL